MSRGETSRYIQVSIIARLLVETSKFLTLEPAGFLHYQLSVPYRKIKMLFKEMFTMDFDPTSCVGFDTKIRMRDSLLCDQLKARLTDTPYLNVDETGWKDKWLWCYADERHAVYRIEPGRGQKELRGALGNSYKGVLISDFLGAYIRINFRLLNYYNLLKIGSVK
ncbi:MAG: transposase [Candidatus Omnitrophota bacterium]